MIGPQNRQFFFFFCGQCNTGVDLQPNFKTIPGTSLVEIYGHLYGHKNKQCTLLRIYYDQPEPRVAQTRGCARRGRTSGTANHQRGGAKRAQNLVRVGKVMRVGHRQGHGVGGCSSGVVRENHIVGSEFSEGMRTHTVRISAGEAFRR